LQLHELHEHTRLLGLESIKQMIHSASSRSHHITVAISDHMPPTFAFRTLLNEREASQFSFRVPTGGFNNRPLCLVWSSCYLVTGKVMWVVHVALPEQRNGLNCLSLLTRVLKMAKYTFCMDYIILSIIKMICARRNCMWPRWRTQQWSS
jgi:hypothetical protein